MPGNQAEEIKSIEDLYRELGNDNEHLVVLKMYFSFCGACLNVLPIYQKSMEKFSGRIRFMQADVEDVEGVAERFNLSHVPTFVAIYKTEELGRYVGVQGERIDAFLERSLEQKNNREKASSSGAIESKAATPDLE